jgi:DNA polymerase-3 subunit gamma/tau
VAQALYRKWRAQTFAELVGQEPITRTLKNAVAANRTAHAYLFCGPRGTGKTSTGRILAKAINCLHPQAGEPCNQCRVCLAINEGRLIDLIEIDAASNRGIDEIRDLREKVRFAPTEARRKVYIIDEVHMLTEPAFNALLKTLEEPPEHVVFILATTEVHKLPATIVSRCQRFDFRRIRPEAGLAKLRQIAAAEGVQADEAALALIVRASAGSLRDAENLLDQAISRYGATFGASEVADLLGLSSDTRARAVVEAALQRDLVAGLRAIGDAAGSGADLRQFSREIVEVLRRVMLTQAGASNLIDSGEEEREFAQRMAAVADPEQVVRVLRRFSEVDLRGETAATLPLELALFDAVHASSTPPATSDHLQGNWPPVPIAAVESSATAPAPPRRRAAPSEPYQPVGELAERWRELQRRLKAVSSKLGALLIGVHPQEITAERVVVSVTRQGAYEMLKKRQQEIASALATVFGHPVAFSVQQRAGTSPTAGTSEASPEDPAHLVHSHTVRHAQRKYQAVIAAIEE